MYFFVCSILKHQLNTDILDKNGTCTSNAVSVSSRNLILFWYCCKKTVKLFGFFCVQFQEYENYCKVVKGEQKLFEQL